MLKSTLQQTDPEIYNIIQEEAERQEYGIELIASENYTSKAVMEAMGSVLVSTTRCCRWISMVST